MAAAKEKKPRKPENEIVARNKRARFDYHIEATVEAGIELQGTEVKSLRDHQASLDQAYARIERREAWLIDVNIAEWTSGSWNNHAPKRKRRLLLHRSEIDKLQTQLTIRGKTIVPLELYFTPKGFAKVLLGVAVGKKNYDKREAIAKRDQERTLSG